MNFSWRVYLALGIVFFLSVSSSLILPMTELLRNLSSFPAILALIGALFQILRDHSAYEKQLLLQERQNLLTLGAASHMANVAFDKHVAFCEQYISEMHKAVSTLFTEGPTEKVLDHASNLIKIRQAFSTWLTPSISQKTYPFETALRTIGANAGLVEATRGTGDISRGRAIKEMYDVFKDVLEVRDESREINNEIAVNEIINKLRAVLGIEELTKLRQYLIEKSISTIEKLM